MRIPIVYHRENNDAAMTPMIDVVFLLLIFFVCTASFQVAEGYLPSHILAAGSGSPTSDIDIDPPLERVLVRTTLRDGRPSWTVNERPCQTLADVRGVLTAVFGIDPTVPVILDIADDVTLGNAIDVYDLCRTVGYDKIQFAVKGPFAAKGAS